MDDEDEVADLNLSSRPLREERQRLRERLRLERGMARSHWHAEDAASPSSQRPSAARFSHGGSGNGAWLQLQSGPDGGGGEEGPNGAGHRGEDSPRLALRPAEVRLSVFSFLMDRSIRGNHRQGRR